MGATPHRWAQAASLRRRWGLSPAAPSRMAAGSDPTPQAPAELRGPGKAGSAQSPAGRRGRGGRRGVEGFGLAPAVAVLAVGPIHLHPRDPRPPQMAGEAGAIGPGALHSYEGHGTEGPEPVQQHAVAGRVRRELLDP